MNPLPGIQSISPLLEWEVLATLPPSPVCPAGAGELHKLHRHSTPHAPGREKSEVPVEGGEQDGT